MRNFRLENTTFRIGRNNGITVSKISICHRIHSDPERTEAENRESGRYKIYKLVRGVAKEIVLNYGETRGKIVLRDETCRLFINIIVNSR